MTGRLFARNAGSAFLLLPKEASDGRLDALFLGCFVEGVLAAVAAAGVAALTVLQAGQTVHQQGDTSVRRRNMHNKNGVDEEQSPPSQVSDVFLAGGVAGLPVQPHGAWRGGRGRLAADSGLVLLGGLWDSQWDKTSFRGSFWM